MLTIILIGLSASSLSASNPFSVWPEHTLKCRVDQFFPYSYVVSPRYLLDKMQPPQSRLLPSVLPFQPDLLSWLLPSSAPTVPSVGMVFLPIFTLLTLPVLQVATFRRSCLFREAALDLLVVSTMFLSSPCTSPFTSCNCLCIIFCSTLGEGNGNPLQSSCLENPMDGGGAW